MNSDFVQVQMSEAGIAFAGTGGTIRVENSRSHFVFTAGKPLRVVKSYEWGYLATQKNADGKPLFELVPAAAPVAPEAPTAEEVAAAAAAAATLAAQHEAASHTDTNEPIQEQS